MGLLHRDWPSSEFWGCVMIVYEDQEIVNQLWREEFLEEIKPSKTWINDPHVTVMCLKWRVEDCLEQLTGVSNGRSEQTG
jgi:hypothetical protein